MNKINTVIFDFDGTIADTNRLIIDSWQEVFRRETGKEADEAMLTATFGEALDETMHRWFGDRSEECLKIYREFQQNIFLERITLFPGMRELLLKLKGEGYKLAVATSRKKDSTIRALVKFDFLDTFDAIVTCDDVTKHKPHPETVLVALEKLGSKPEEAVMIGDSIYDIMCGKNAGTHTIFVNWAVASCSPEKKAACPPDYTVDTAEEIGDILAAN